MVRRLKRAFTNVGTIIDIVQKTARGIDYRTLNTYILRINELQDINGILYEVSMCLKSILNSELFGFAIKDGPVLDVWIDPRVYKGHFIEIIQKDFDCQNIDNFHYFDNHHSMEYRTSDIAADNVLSYKVMDKEYAARLYILPRRKMLSHHNEIISIIIETMRIVLDNYMSRKKLENAAAIDALTNCYNRRAMDSFLDHHVAIAHRYGSDLSVIMFDIDHFKQINDTFGHQAGDAVLRDIPRIILPSIRKSDYIARYGGEEFVLVLPNTKFYFAVELAERLRVKLQNHAVAFGNQLIGITSSFGVASLRKEYDKHQLLKEADTMLYKAKHAGRNKVMPDLELCAEDFAALRKIMSRNDLTRLITFLSMSLDFEGAREGS